MQNYKINVHNANVKLTVQTNNNESKLIRENKKVNHINTATGRHQLLKKISEE